MGWRRQTLTTGKSDSENASGHAVGLQGVGSSAAEPPFENRIKHIACDSVSCGEREIDEKMVPAVLKVFFQAHKFPSDKSRPSVSSVIDTSSKFTLFVRGGSFYCWSVRVILN
jgi:hypothetical protein